VEIIVDESVFLYVWRGNGVPTRPVTRGANFEPAYNTFS